MQLVNQAKRAGQPFEVGTMITTMAQPSTKPQVITRIIFHFKFLKSPVLMCHSQNGSTCSVYICVLALGLDLCSMGGTVVLYLKTGS